MPMYSSNEAGNLDDNYIIQKSEECLRQNRFVSFYCLALLWLTHTVSNLDRAVLAVLIQPIKADLKLSDLEVGLLTGFAFSFFYAVSSVPMAYISDRGFRHTLICTSLATWGLFTSACGFSYSFLQLLLARFGVGAAESGVSPSAQAMVYELFPGRTRNSASAILQSGAATGAMLAFSLGAFLEGYVGWRWTFIIVSLPSFIIGIVFFLTVPNTQKNRRDAGLMVRDSWRDLVAKLLANRAFFLICIACGLQVVLLGGLPQWMPAYIERSFATSRVEIGGMIAVTNGIGMMTGMLLGGPFADILSRFSPLWPARLMLISVLLASPPSILMFLSRDLSTVYFLIAVTSFLIAIPAGIIPAMMQQSVESSQRASAAAGIVLTTSLIGTGLTPAVVGLLSDLYMPDRGAESLRYALMTVTAINAPLLCWVFFRVYQLQASHSSAEGPAR